MTSLRKKNANRRNAQWSTGPKSFIGKQRSALNSNVHGLSSTATFEGEDLQVVKSLAQDFMGNGSKNDEIVTLAHLAAGHQIMMWRARSARLNTWQLTRSSEQLMRRGEMFGYDDILLNANIDSIEKRMVRLTKKFLPHLFEEPSESNDERDIVTLKLVANQLKKLVRYERKAANGRDKALRKMEKIKLNLKNVDLMSEN